MNDYYEDMEMEYRQGHQEPEWDREQITNKVSDTTNKVGTRLCPFCGSDDNYNVTANFGVTVCRTCGASAPIEKWGDRLLEDKLIANCERLAQRLAIEGERDERHPDLYNNEYTELSLQWHEDLMGEIKGE